MHDTGMSTAKTSVQADGGPLARGALRHDLVKQLLTDIFEGRMPAGTRFIVLSLADRFKISSTPVREALLELEAIGVAQFAHNRGAVVKPFGPADLREIYQLRRILEVEATRCACGRIDAAALEQLKAELVALRSQRRGKQWLEREMETDRELHGMISAACGSTRLAEELRRYDTLVQSLRNVVRDNCDARQEALDEHVTIIDALLADDAVAAADRMSRHVDGRPARLFP